MTPRKLRAPSARGACIATTLALALLPAAAGGAAINWAPDADGFWDVAANWSPSLPGAGDDVTINVGGAVVRLITHRTGTTTIRTINNAETVDVTTGSTLQISSGGLASTNTGTLRANNGTLNLISSALNNAGGTLSAINGGVISLNGSAIGGGTLTTSGGGVIQTVSGGNTLDGSVAQVSITGGSTVRLNNSTSLSLLGTVNNLGTIALNSSGNLTNLIVGTGGTVTLQGGGQITLSDSINNRIYSDTAGSVLNNVDHIISGGGQIFSNIRMALQNQASGVIDANSVNRLQLQDFSGTWTLVNNGILRSSNTTASNGGLLIQSSTVDNTGNSNGGRITAIGANTHVDLFGSTILGGTLTTSGGGVIQTVGNPSVLNGSAAQVNIASGSTVRVNNNTGLGLVGTINNAGTIALNSTGSSTNLIVGTGGTVTLQGGGQITLSDNINNRIYSDTAGSVLNNVDHIISGGGQIFSNIRLALQNQAGGVIDANGVNQLQLRDFRDLGASGDFTLVNNGILRSTNTTASNGGLLIQSTTVDNTGSSNGGRITAIGANTHVDLNNTTIRGGTLTTSGGGVIQTVTGTGSTLDGSVALAPINLAGGSTVRVVNNSSLGLLGTINTAGTIALNSTGSSTNLIVGTGGTVTLQGGGQITLSDHASLANRIYSDTASSVLNNVDNTISGAGQILSNNRMALQNQALGIIDANGVNQLQVKDFTGTWTLVNNGILRSSNTTLANGGLLIQSTTVDNTGNGNGGRITAIGANTHVDLQNSTIKGGTLTTSGGGVIQTVTGWTGALDGSGASAPINLAGGSTVRVVNNSSLGLLGTINNAGAIALGSSGNITSLRLANSAQLTGGGVITLSDNVNNWIWGSANTGLEVVTNVNNTISGAGAIGAGNSILFINQASGVINANGTAALTITPTTNNSTGLITTHGGGFVNQGLLQATNTGGLVLNGGQFNNAGSTIQAVGAGSSVTLQSTVTVSGGTLAGTGGGLIQTASGHSATLDGTSQGTLTIAGTYLANNNSSTFLSGTINNTGTIAINSTGNLTDLRLANGTQLTGGGAITLSNNTNNRIWGTTNTGQEVVTNVNNTISGAGAIGVGNSTLFINQASGVINANGTNALTITPTTNNSTGLITANGGGFVNQGLLQATNTGGLVLNGGQFNNSGGSIQAVGAGSSVTLQSTVTVSGGTLTGTGGGLIQTASGHSATLDGTSQGALTIVGSYLANNNSSTFLSGTINNTGTIAINSTGSLTDLRFANGTQLTGGGTITLSNNANNRIWGTTNTGVEVVTNVNNTIQGAGSFGVSNSIGIVNGGTIDATGTVALTMAPSTNAALTAGLVNQAGGVLRGSGTGGLSITQGKIDNQGLVEALAGSNVTYGVSATTLNNVAGTLTGGTWRANSVGGSSATITLRGSNITTNAADIYLVGANSNINVAGTSIDTTLFTNNGSLRLQQGRTFNATANSGNFTNAGLLEVTDGTFQSSTLASNGAIASFGNSTVTTGVGNRISGNGSITANTGTLTITRGVNMGASSSMTSNAGATINLAGAALPSQIGTLANNGALNLGTQNIVVLHDYTNANFGIGNAFNARANVSGTGLIIGSNASQTIAGGITAAGANTWNLNLGNIRGGTSTTVNYQIANNGTGADIRGAVQTSVNGGNIDDARISGSGATAGNFGPIAAGGNSGNLGVTFNATSGGSLTGQSIAVVSNFSNVATQIINLSGQASALAQGSATPNSNPVNLGNFRVGGSLPSQNFAVQNTTGGAGAERLGIASATTIGNFGATNNLGSGFIDPGASLANAVTAAVSGGTAGVNSGSVSIQYTTNGTLIDPSFTTINANSQTINLQATGYNVAQGNATPSPVALANQRVGGSATQALTVTNTAPAGGFTEGLNATFAANTGNATNNSGSISLLAGGASNSVAMSVGVDTSAAGTRSGTVTLNYVSDGSGTSGLGQTSVGSQTINVSGNVYRIAQPTLASNSVAFTNRHVGDVASQALSITNTSAAPVSFQEALNASFSGTSGQATAAGSVNLLGQGASNTSSLIVGLDTSSAGAKSGTATLALASDGTGTSGLGTLALSPQTVAVSGNVYRLAQATLGGPLYFGNVLVGSGPVTRTLTVSNSALNDGFSEALNASFGALINNGAGSFSSSGSIGGLLAGQTDNVTMQVTLNPTSAGSISATYQILLDSNGTAIGNGLGITALPSQLVGLQGLITGVAGNLAQASAATPNPVNFGNVRVGTTATQALTISNIAAAPAEGLNASIASNHPGVVNASGSFTSLAAGSTNNSSLVVGINTATAGAKSGSANITLESDGTYNNGVPTSLPSQTVNVSGNVFQIAQPTAVAPNPVALANQRVGGTLTQALSITNANAAPAGFQEGLNANFSGATAQVTTAGAIVNLAQGATDTTTLRVGVDTSSAGAKSGSATLALASNGTVSGLADLALGSQTVNVSGNVYNPAVAQLNTTSATLVARVGDAAPSQAISISNAAPVGPFSEGLKATLGAAPVPFNTAGSTDVTNLIAGGTDAASLRVGLNTATAGSFAGSIGVTFASTGAGTSGLADLALGTQSVGLSGKVYTPAQAQITNTTINFGIVHVGDSVSPIALNVANIAPVTALNDTLKASFGAVSGPFSGTGSIAGLAAGATDGTSMQVGLNTASAGVFNGSGSVELASRNADMADLALSPSGLILSGQVNNYANPLFNKIGGAGSLTHSGNSFTLDLGDLIIGSGSTSSSLGVLNDVFGPADLVDGTFDLSGANDFSLGGFVAFSNLGAGDVFAGLLASLAANSLGSFDDVVLLNATAHNASGFNQQIMLTLLLHANVVPQGTAPEPSTAALLLAALVMLSVVRRRGRASRSH